MPKEAKKHTTRDGKPILKRNAACTTCRSRKLKCDAIEPVCGSCSRSYNYAVARLKAGQEPPPYPSDCCYGVVKDPVAADKIKYLEKKLEAFEAMLQTQQATAIDSALPPPTTEPTPSSSSSLMPQASDILGVVSASASSTSPETVVGSDVFSGVDALLQADARVPDDSWIQELIYPGWPPHLPSREKLDSILHVFFSTQSFAQLIFDKGRFMTRVALQPTHCDFPHAAVLHAICAVTARFLGSVPVYPPDHEALSTPANQSFSGRSRTRSHELKSSFFRTNLAQNVTTEFLMFDNREDGIAEDFGMRHDRLARLYAMQSQTVVTDWLPLCQTFLLLNYYGYQHTKWVNGWSDIGAAVRFASPLGLFSKPGHKNGAGQATSLLSEPTSDVDRIERQNLMWLLFIQDTMGILRSGWSSCIADEDLVVGLPVSPSPSPILSAPEPTQFLYSEDNMFTNHPPVHCNSFALRIKGMLLLRRVAKLNRRVELREESVDPRYSDAFIELDRLLESFITSFPNNLQNFMVPGRDGKAIDRELLGAQTVPYVALILLHERYADVSDAADHSTKRLLASARALLSQICLLSSTNFDVCQLYHLIFLPWSLGAATLLKFLKVSINRGHLEETKVLRGEVDMFRIAIAQIATRLPLGVRQLEIIESLDETKTDSNDAGPLSGTLRLQQRSMDSVRKPWLGSTLGTAFTGPPSKRVVFVMESRK